MIALGGSFANRKPRRVRTENLHQFLVYDLDHLLRRREGGQHFLTHRFRLDAFDQLLDNLEVNVGFEQRDANFAQRLPCSPRRVYPRRADS
jgi:hypothetical protein